MYEYYFIYVVDAKRRKDEIAAAESQHLIRQLGRKASPNNLRMRHILLAFGNHLVSLGNWLQKRYADLPAGYPAATLTKSQTGEC